MNEIEIYYRPRKSGKGHVLEVQVTFKMSNGKRDKYRQSSGLRIPIEEWDRDRREPTAKFAMDHPEWYQNFKEFQAAVQSTTEDVIKDGEPLTKGLFRKHFSVRFQKKSMGHVLAETNSLPKYLDEFIPWFIQRDLKRPESKQKAFRTHQQYMKIFNRLKRYFEQTNERILIELASMDYVDQFVAWFEQQNKRDGTRYAQNTLADHEKWTIALLNKALGCRLNMPNWNPRASEERIPRVESDNIHFDLLDLQKIMNYSPSSSHLKTVQTWSVIAFCTGLRVSDWPRFHELLSGSSQPRIGEDVDRINTKFGTYRYVQLRPQKTSKRGSGSVCGIPILQPIEIIIAKNGFPHPISGQNFNESLKTLAVKAGIDEDYTFRRILSGESESQTTLPKGRFATSTSFGRSSFITLLHEFVPKPVHSKVTGHSISNGDAFDTYVRDLHLKQNAARFLVCLKAAQDNAEFDIAERQGVQIPINIRLIQ